LLGFVETMDLINEDISASPGEFEVVTGFRNDRLDLLDPRRHSGKGYELALCGTSDKSGQSGLATSRRPPENQRGHPVLFNSLTKRASDPDDLLLADKTLERFRPHAIGQRFDSVPRVIVRIGWSNEKIHDQI